MRFQNLKIRIVPGFLFFLLLILNDAAGQNTYPQAVNLDSIKYGRRILYSCQFAAVPRDFPMEDFSSVKMTPLLSGNFKIGPQDISKDILLRFHLKNNLDTLRNIILFPGLYFQDMWVYSISGQTAKPLPRILPGHPDSLGFRKISVPANDSFEVLARLRPEKTYNVVISPRLIREEYFSAYMLEYSGRYTDIDLVTYIFCGLLLMMILFSLASYAMGANWEFLYYAGYALMLGAMLFTKSLYTFRINPISYAFETYIDFVLQSIGHCSYLAFMILFLEARKKHPFLFNLFRYSILVVIITTITYSIFHFSTSFYYPEYLAENITKFYLMGVAIVFMVYATKHWQDRLLRFLFYGNFFLLFFSIGSQALILLPSLRANSGIFYNALFYYELGLFIELIYFLVGLAYKNRRQIILQTREKERLKMDNERKELEKQVAVMAAHQEERERISADMHDELGSGMTTIRLMSEIAKNKMKHDIPPEIEKISQSANDVLNKMNAIIWSMNSENDTLDNLVSYIRAYSIEYFDGTPVNCLVNTPKDVPGYPLSGDKRRNIFLCLKETLNNVLKHANARQVIIDIQVNHQLIIQISDNGDGIDLAKIREFGNGLKNIQRRMLKIGGEFGIENRNGTVTRLVYPLGR